LTWIPGASAIVTGPIDLFGFDSTADYTVPSIDDGKAFLVQGRLVDETGFVIGAFIDEYVPTPAAPSLALVGVGFAALIVSQRRRGGWFPALLLVRDLSSCHRPRIGPWLGRAHRLVMGHELLPPEREGGPGCSPGRGRWRSGDMGVTSSAAT